MQTTPSTLHRRVEPLPWHARPAALAWRRECVLALVFLLLLAAALLGPSVAQPAHYHDFADQRSWEPTSAIAPATPKPAAQEEVGSFGD